MAIFGRHGRLLAGSGCLSLPEPASPPAAAELLDQSQNGLVCAAPVRLPVAETDPLFDEPAAGSHDVSGTVVVELDTALLNERRRQVLLRGDLLAALGLVLLAIFASLTAGAISHPILALARAVNAMADGALDTRVAAVSSSELGAGTGLQCHGPAHRRNAAHARSAHCRGEGAAHPSGASRDPLTGLPNRRAFERLIEEAFAAVAGGEPDFCPLFIDLDRFKQVNDASGHLAGDELLRQVAQLMKSRRRDEDLLARVGGDEFCVLLHACALAEARHVAADLCALIDGWRFVWHDRVFAIGASLGIALDPYATALIAAADAACYRAKEVGRGRACTTPTGERRRPSDRAGSDRHSPGGGCRGVAAVGARSAHRVWDDA